MGNPAQESFLRALAETIEEVSERVYDQKMGFILCIAPFDAKPNVSDYIANGRREDCIKWLRETADRLEANEDIPATQGEA